MFEFIYQSLTSSFHFETKTDFFKIIGFHVFVLLGILFSLFLFVSYLTGFLVDSCLPGSISLAVTFFLSFYALLNKSIKWAINSFYLIPIAIYYFFISETFSIFPIHLSIHSTLFAFFPFILIFIFYSENKVRISQFFLIIIATVVFHSYITGQTECYSKFNGILKGKFTIRF
jgi:hypothetical protein